MRILLKCPTRSRPQKVLECLRRYVSLATHPEQMGVAVSCDVDDASMKNPWELTQVLSRCEWSRIFYSPNTSKIQACNANMDEIDYPWDIVVLVSDDMQPQIRGYDEILRNHMRASFPDTDGILWCNDGYQGDKLNTLTILGRTMFQRLGHLYEPEYKSLFCDTELTDRCRGDLASKCVYIPHVLIRHEHPGTGYAQTMDPLYARNQKFWNEDMHTYIRRKTYPIQWSVLIPTIPGREESLRRLVESIHDKVKRLAPEMTYEIRLGFDNREQSIGLKRDGLLQGAKGKYMSFIDDDDEITDAYIEDLWATIQGGFHVMRLRGQIAPYTFTHSTENALTGPMARGEVFLRPPNHLNPMLTDVAKLLRFKDATRGEDLEWTIRLARAGFLTTEYRSDPSRIHYLYLMGTRTVDPGSLAYQAATSYETMLSMVWTPAGAQAPRPAEPSRIPLLRLTSRGFVSS
jgi:hypothetical protein